MDLSDSPTMVAASPFVMRIDMDNKTSNTMKYLGAAIYNGYGAVKVPGRDVAAKSTGNGGTLHKEGGTNGLFGLVAYSCPDPNQMLVIYIYMRALAGTLNRCYIGLADSSRQVDGSLATDAYNLRLRNQTEGTMDHRFTQDGMKYSMQVFAKVDDQKAYETFSSVEISLTALGQAEIDSSQS